MITIEEYQLVYNTIAYLRLLYFNRLYILQITLRYQLDHCHAHLVARRRMIQIKQTARKVNIFSSRLPPPTGCLHSVGSSGPMIWAQQQ